MNNEIYIHCEGKDEYNLIEKLPDIIRSIITSEIGLPAGFTEDMVINTDSFDIASNSTNGKRNDWKGAFSLNKKINSLDLISELARESSATIILDSLNRQKIIVLDPETNITKTISYNDIQKNENGFPKIKVYKTDTENIFNSFSIEYNYNYLTKNFQRIDFINKDSTSLSSAENTRSGSITTFTGLCLNSFQRYDKIANYNIEAKYIQDRDTAILLLKWYCEWLTRKRYIVEIEGILNNNLIPLETGDQVKININILPTGVDNVAAFMLIDSEIDYLNDEIKLKLLEISYPV